ncbi:hypothetical protein [Gordonia polyisoprenivorans]|uniref:hypothetical protein n=1 Tax=Gordonia polyisoprenivorans TaxID=84595 RepID=UPI002301D88F|nr:hypothetical protein [Gordonia polyisoprenivorans]WCB35577.1 hypothetical protein PHA63_15805 [Gordonia polyisoprenivorans]
MTDEITVGSGSRQIRVTNLRTPSPSYLLERGSAYFFLTPEELTELVNVIDSLTQKPTTVTPAKWGLGKLFRSGDSV